MSAAAPTVNLLELRGIRASYDTIEVLHGIDLVIPAGTVVAALGPNGAGKTTMLRVLCGLLAPTAGDLVVAGRRRNGVAASALARLGVCTIPEGRGVFPNLTVRENLRMMTHSGRAAAAVEEQAFRYFPRLAERRGQLAGTMSGGEQQMLAMARAIATDPAVLLLDELSMGLAPLVVEELYRAVRELAAAGVAILVIEQFAQTALALADTAVVLSQGRITASGSPEAITAHLHDAYLGPGQGQPLVGSPR